MTVLQRPRIGTQGRRQCNTTYDMTCSWNTTTCCGKSARRFLHSLRHFDTQHGSPLRRVYCQYGGKALDQTRVSHRLRSQRKSRARLSAVRSTQSLQSDLSSKRLHILSRKLKITSEKIIVLHQGEKSQTMSTYSHCTRYPRSTMARMFIISPRR